MKALHEGIRMMNTLIPTWMVKVVVTTVLTLLVTGASAWGVHLSSQKNSHENRIVKVEDRIETIREDIKEIKDGQKEMNRKLDRLIERGR